MDHSCKSVSMSSPLRGLCGKCNRFVDGGCADGVDKVDGELDYEDYD